jgi:signal transduction histidine kinase
MQFISRKNITNYFLPALFVVVLIVNFLKPAQDNLQTIASRIEITLHQAQNEFDQSVSNQQLQSALLTGSINSSVFEKLKEKNIALFLFAGDSLMRWTNNVALPRPNVIGSNSSASILKLRNGWYYCMKQTITHDSLVLIGLVPVKYNYPFENKFLQNEFVLSNNIPGNIEITDTQIDGSVQVRSSSGAILCSLYVSGKEEFADTNLFLLVSQLLILLLLLYFIHAATTQLRWRFGFVYSLLFLVAVLILVRAVMIGFGLPSQFGLLELFKPKYYASSILIQSLGDLMLDTAFVAWIVFYSAQFLPEKFNSTNKLLAYFLVAVIFCYTALVTWLFKTIVIDSVISFEVYDILSISLYSVYGLACIGILLITHFIISKRIIEYAIDAALTWKQTAIPLLIFGLLYASMALYSQFTESIVFSSVWTIGFVLLGIILQRRNRLVQVRSFILYVTVYSILSSFFIENMYETKERNQREFFAGKLVNERDFVAEYLFIDAAEKIKDDAFVKSFFNNPVISHKEVVSRISALYLGGYFNKYDLTISVFDTTGHPVRGADSSFVNKPSHIKNSLGQLLYESDTAQNYSYVSWLPIASPEKVQGYIKLELIPKVYYGQNVYPELLIGSNIALSNITYNYDYAIYKNNKLIAQSGEFPYTYYWNKNYDFGDEDYTCIEEEDWEHSIQRFPNGKRVVVTIAREPVFEPIATFSYLFTFYFLLTALVAFIAIRFAGTNPQYDLFERFALSLRTRINYSMLFMIVISFIIIGIITISFFSRQYDSFYTDKLLRKEKVVHSSLEYYMQRSTNETLTSDGALLGSGLNLEVVRLAAINDIDINVFDPNGNLFVTSQPAIYEKGLVSKRMNPSAFTNLSQNVIAEATEQESIGKLKYLATYATLRSSKGNVMAYIGIPYFERSKNINDEVSSFLVSLMNVYVFLLICAAILAYFVSNSITKPLTIISEKLRILNLNKRNEPIEWNSNDEIGTLVSEYNKMITELEQSAQKLAKSERESAWREMAKQIAHEIKNPLTPMKLSIQYLQRAINDGNPNIEQLAKKVTKTLEEQIENLSSIATAFSSFAKMPKAENELINLNDLLKSIAELFNREKLGLITFTSKCEDAFVFADKNQLVSVFNNLVKNALQSIPENREGFVEIEVSETEGWINTSVRDNGSGIPVENRDKVFVPNFTTKSSGTGLGLAITKQIIDGAGGTIWFETSDDGTVFYVRLKKTDHINS